MYVIFPLDKLLDIDSASKHTTRNPPPSTQTQPGAPPTGQQSLVKDVPTPSTLPGVQKPGQSGPTNLVNQSSDPSANALALQKDRLQTQHQEKSSKGGRTSPPTPSTLTLSPNSAHSPLKQQVLSNLGPGATSTSTSPTGGLSAPTPKGLQRQVSLTLPSGEKAPVVQKSFSARLPSTSSPTELSQSSSYKNKNNLPPQKKSASACASSSPSRSGPSPPALRDTSSSEITGSASIFLNRASEAPVSNHSVSFSDNTNSLTRQQRALKSDSAVRPEITRSDTSSSFRAPSSSSKDKKDKGTTSSTQVLSDSRKGPESKKEQLPNPIIILDSTSDSTSSNLHRSEWKSSATQRCPTTDLKAGSPTTPEGKRETPTLALKPRPPDEHFQGTPDIVVVAEGSPVSEVVVSSGVSSATSRSRESSTLGGKVFVSTPLSSASTGSSSTSPQQKGHLSKTSFPFPAQSPSLTTTSLQHQRNPSPSFRSRKRGIMATGDHSFKDLSYPALNETLKSYNSVTFKLIKTVADFSTQLSQLHERHAQDLQLLVENYRKKHSDLRNERPQCGNQMFQAWETLLQEVEVDSQLHSDVAGTFVRQVSRPLVEKTFHRKIQSRKLFTQRESIETILGKTEEMLKKCRRDHTEAYQSHCRTQSNASLAAYFDAHNAYVQQLHATNAMLHHYNLVTQPTILQELEDVHIDVSGIVVESIIQGADILANKAMEQNMRYDNLGAFCRSVDNRADVVSLVKFLDTPSMAHKGAIPQHRFLLPQPPPPPEDDSEQIQPPELPSFQPLKNELVLDRLAALSSRTRLDSLKKEAADLDKQILTLQEGMDALLRVQQRNLESSLYHKANELQEDISMKRFELRVSLVHLAAVKAQKELFASKEGGSTTEPRDRKMSSVSTGSMKSKWMKAFKSLKTTTSGSGSGGAASGGATARDTEKKNGRDRGMESPVALFENSHILQEYTYKKITACDVCHQILRGHSRQGLKCRLCKTNVHLECQERLPKCQPKSKLLRRQRSTSEIESKQMDAGEEESETVLASQPGRRMKEPPSPSTSSSYSPEFPLPPKGPSSSNLV